MGAQIRDMRKRAKKSQELIAAEVGTTRRNWIRWEQGANAPSPEFRPKIAAALGVDESFFADDAEEDSLLQDLTRALVAAMRAAVVSGFGEPGGREEGWAGANSKPGSPNPTMRTVN